MYETIKVDRIIHSWHPSPHKTTQASPKSSDLDVEKTSPLEFNLQRSFFLKIVHEYVFTTHFVYNLSN